VPIDAGTYTLDPSSGELIVRTTRTGAAAKAGHNLKIAVSAWQATLEAGVEPSDLRIELAVDGGSLKVLEGTGGVQSLDDDHKREISETIDNEVLKREQIAFRSTSAAAGDDGTIRVTGDLTLNHTSRPITFDVASTDGSVTAATVIKQSDWGMKPYSTLFGALKVVDEVEISIDARLGDPS
jgi:polyisoprenoid-binding protein YceI